MHRTLKQAATQPPEQTLEEQQRRFESFRSSYNRERPHEALAQKTPASCYQPSRREYTDTPAPLLYPDYYDVRRVKGSGIVHLRGHRVYVTHLLEGYDVGLNEIAQGVWEVYFGPLRLGRIDERDAQRKSVSYLSLKSVTHVP